MFGSNPPLSFRGCASSGYEVFACGQRVGRVWKARNTLLGQHWKNSRLHLHAGTDNTRVAFRTRRDAALDLCGLAGEIVRAPETT